jgi:hypothetical protein
LCYEIYVTPEETEEYYAGDEQDYYDELDNPADYYDDYPEGYWEETHILYADSEDDTTTGE